MKKKSKFLGHLLVAITGIGVLLGSLFLNSDELAKNDEESDDVVNQKAIVYRSNKKSLKKVFYFLRCFVFMPIWIITTFILKLIKKLLDLLAFPILKYLLIFLIVFLILLLIIILSIKLMYPELKLREIINTKMIISTLISSLLIDLSFILYEYYYKDYEEYLYLLVFIFGFFDILYNLYPYIKFKLNKKAIELEKYE